MKLRLTGKGYEDFTGQMGAVYFEHGLSVIDVLPMHATRIAVAIGAVWENGDLANPADLLVANINKGMTNAQGTDFDARLVEAQITDADKAQKHFEKVAQFGSVALQEADVEISPPEYQKVTREQLEAIADEKGLTGLRELAAQYNIKGKSINELIDRLLEKLG